MSYREADVGTRVAAIEERVTRLEHATRRQGSWFSRVWQALPAWIVATLIVGSVGLGISYLFVLMTASQRNAERENRVQDARTCAGAGGAFVRRVDGHLSTDFSILCTKDGALFVVRCKDGRVEVGRRVER